MSEANKQLVRRYYEVVIDDLARIDEIVADGFVDHHFPPGLPPGPACVRQFFGQIAPGIFSHMEIRIERMVAEGDLVDCHFALHATHTGPFGAVAPKGNAIVCPAISTFRIACGKLAEAWEIFDSGDLVRQMQA
ncbi:MAG: ester cyclase [Thermoguttaceae bacterium]